jgi:hypothetical protein
VLRKLVRCGIVIFNSSTTSSTNLSKSLYKSTVRALRLPNCSQGYLIGSDDAEVLEPRLPRLDIWEVGDVFSTMVGVLPQKLK